MPISHNDKLCKSESRSSILYTFHSRLRNVLGTRRAIKSLLLNLPFATKQAMRTINGAQLNDVLHLLSDLDKIQNYNQNILDGSLIGLEEFENLTKKFGAGKKGGHKFIYTKLNLQRSSILNVLELGIGTNNQRLASAMWAGYTPGSSLRLWSEVFHNATIIGADVDKNILINQGRISSFWTDQNSENALSDLSKKVKEKGKLGLIIDDGLHTPEANLRTFLYLSDLLELGGYYIIEDIEPAWEGFWKMVGNSLDKYESTCLRFPGTQVADCFFVARKVK
jgi:hypothetical protein